jgi:hypothetical protein
MLRLWPVSRRVNRSGQDDDPGLIEPLGGIQPMPTRSRKRGPPSTRRRALELLAASPDGVTDAILAAHGFTLEQMVDLVRRGLATATAERVTTGERSIEVARIRITAAGRKALAGTKS